MKLGRPDYTDSLLDLQLRIPGDEPVFLLRAGDVHATAAIRLWADRNAADPNGDADLVALARNQAALMDAYRIEHGGRLADLVPRMEPIEHVENEPEGVMLIGAVEGEAPPPTIQEGDVATIAGIAGEHVMNDPLRRRRGVAAKAGE